MIPAASVIIPARDAEETLGAQLAALAGQRSAPEFEVVVVLDRCSDRTEAVARAFADDLRLIVLETVGGPSVSRARNTGARSARAPLLLFCDADDQVGTRWVEGMVCALEAGADLVGGRILVARTGLADWMYEVQYRSFDGRCIQQAYGVPYVIGASLGCRRSAFEAVGGFDERYVPAGGEDLDFAIRLMGRGLGISEAPGATVTYQPRRRIGGLLRQACRNARGSVLCAARHGLLGTSPPPNRRAVLGRTVRRTAHLVLREGERRPGAVTFHAVRSWYQLRAEYDSGR